MFVVGMAAGLLAQSSGLMADALDMLTDATAYALALMAVTGVRDSSGTRPGGPAQRSRS
jgi:Co/Zn/Cd efflux system component